MKTPTKCPHCGRKLTTKPDPKRARLQMLKAELRSIAIPQQWWNRRERKLRLEIAKIEERLP